MTGVLPTKTSIRLSAPDGSHGTLPGATETAAGCMTADHARRLETLWQIHQTRGDGVVVIEPPRPAADVVTRDQLVRLMQAMPRPPDVRLLEQELADLRSQMQALPAPGVATDVGLREIVQHIIAQASAMDERLREVERVIDVLRHVAAVKAAMEEAA